MWSRSLETAVANLVATGVSVVVAAGNSAKDSCQVAPARVPEAVTVAASNLPTKFQETSSGMFAAQHATKRCTAWYVELHGGECSSLPDLNPATSALSSLPDLEPCDFSSQQKQSWSSVRVCSS